MWVRLMNISGSHDLIYLNQDVTGFTSWCVRKCMGGDGDGDFLDHSGSCVVD